MKLLLVFVFALTLALTPALAHHSFAMYDQTKTVTLTGVTWFYDKEAFVEPLYDLQHYNRVAKMDDANRRYTYIECLSNLRNTNGRPTQLTAADPRFIDYYGRPWAQNWEKYFEVGWDKPADDLPKDVLDVLDQLDKRK